MTYKKKAIPQATRRAVAVRYGCEPGTRLEGVPCHWCGELGWIHWHRLYGGKPSGWVSFSHHLDHVVPEFHGGTMDPDNFVLACRSCNSRKRDSYWPPEKSMSDSGATQEPVCKNVSGKGREGKGIGREGKGSSSIPNPIRLVSDAPSPERWGWGC